MATKTSLQRDDNGRSLVRLELENNTGYDETTMKKKKKVSWHMAQALEIERFVGGELLLCHLLLLLHPQKANVISTQDGVKIERCRCWQ